MSKINNTIINLITTIKANFIELWATLSLFAGLPIVAWLYFDYRAALFVFFVASCVIGILAMRSK